MSDRRADRLEQIIRRLQRGKPLRVGEQDAPERDAIMTAAQLAGARQPNARMRPEFRQQLGELLSSRAQPSGWTRRQALGGGLAAAAGLVVGVGLDRLVAPLDQERAPGAFVVPSSGRWIDVAAVVDLPEGQPTHVTAGAVSGYVFRAGSNVHAVSSTCSHYPCALSWDSSQRNILCPCHMQRFSSDGQPIAAGYELPPLKRLRVRVLDGRVQVLGTA